MSRKVKLPSKEDFERLEEFERKLEKINKEREKKVRAK